MAYQILIVLPICTQVWSTRNPTVATSSKKNDLPLPPAPIRCHQLLSMVWHMEIIDPIDIRTLSGLILCKSCASHHSCCWVHEWNGHTMSRRQHFTALLPALPPTFSFHLLFCNSPLHYISVTVPYPYNSVICPLAIQFCDSLLALHFCNSPLAVQLCS